MQRCSHVCWRLVRSEKTVDDMVKRSLLLIHLLRGRQSGHERGSETPRKYREHAKRYAVAIDFLISSKSSHLSETRESHHQASGSMNTLQGVKNP